MEENQNLKICQYCQNYNKPKCKITNEFVARKKLCINESEFFKFKKNINIKTVSKKKTEISDHELKKQIFESQLKLPKHQKPKKTKHK